MMMADTNNNHAISADECYNVEDPMMMDACSMVTEWCDYDMDG